jgi:cell wall-associated NlpC family hydrolase
MSRGALVAAEARQWIGTRFVWGQSQKGVGCDCKGLVQGVARELGFSEAQGFYANFASYRPDKPVPANLLREGMAAVFDRAEDIAPGDVLLLRWAGKAGHLAVVTDRRKAVHAQIAPTERVKEASLRSLLKLFPLDSIWRWRD